MINMRPCQDDISRKALPSIDEVAEVLRAKGELDEEKYTKFLIYYKQRIKFLIRSVLFFAVLAIFIFPTTANTIILISIFFYFLYSFFQPKHVANITACFYVFNLGKRRD